jgi:glycosyltransferase involved in cell wall biosynthesis
VTSRAWSINGRFATQPVTGVQRYAHEIVRALDAHIAAEHPLARGLDVELVLPEAVTLPYPLQAIPVRVAGGASGHLWEQLVLPGAARGGILNLCNTGPLRVRKQLVCIHDVNTRICPGSYSWKFRALYRVLHPLLGRVAERISTVSQFSASEIARLGIAPPEKISVIPDGYEHALRWEPKHSEATRAVAGPDTVLIIGSPAPHKNVGLVLGLAEALKAAGLRVAVAGARDARVFSGVPDLAGADNIVWLGRVSDAELAALLRDCLCLAFPSLTEGFGIPALEAMALGCPVVVSDRASLPEICGDAALYASPNDAQAWLRQLKLLKSDARLRGDLVAKGPAQAAKFSWRRSAELYLEAMARSDGVAL